MDESNSISDQIRDFVHEVVDNVFGNERQRELARFAQSHDYYFLKRMYARNLDIEVKALSVFRKRKTRKVYNFMTKDVASLKGRLGIFDYWLQSDAHNRKTTFLLLKSEYFKFPHIRIEPKNAFERFGEFFLLKKIFLDYHPEFNKKFTIHAKYQEDINRIVPHELADFFIEEKNLQLEGLGNYLLIYRKGKLCTPENFPDFIDTGMAVSEFLKKEE